MISHSLFYLGKNKEWEIIYTHVHALDLGNHRYQNKILEEYTGEKHEYYLDILRKYYEISDKFVGNMLELVDEDTTLFIVSDHGGMSKEAGCEIPLLGDPWNVGGKVLEEMGYLVVNREKDKAEVDWKKTKAISQRSGYIYLNLKGREPQGSVEPEEYEQLVEEIIAALYSYRDPQTGKRPINFALSREDMPILGLYGEHVGDIYFCFTPSFARVHGTTPPTANYSGTSVKCLFLMAGAGVKKGEEIKRPVRAIDIVPTICHLTGFPVPQDAEGGIIYQGLEE